MGNCQSSIPIECILIIESKTRDVFPILCKYISDIKLDGILCNYHINKETKSSRSSCNFHKKISKANFVADNIENVIKLWETLKVWRNLTKEDFSFSIFTKREGISYWEFKNEEKIRYEFERIPSYMKIYFN
jgi:hypothetical protein